MSTSKRSGACMRCGQNYIDLLDHIKRNTETTSSPAGTYADSTLVVCPCGRVVLNHAGLLKHRVRYGCVESTPKPSITGSSPLTSPPPSTTAITHRPLPPSSPLTSAPPSTSTQTTSQLSSPPTAPGGDLLARLTLHTRLSSSPASSSTPQRPSRLASSTPSRLAPSTPQRSSRLASQPRSPVDVDHDYGGDGMELDAMPDEASLDEASLDGSRWSDAGSVWSPSEQSEASGTPTSPSSPSTAPPSPTRPSLTLPSNPPASPTPLSPTLLAALEEDPFPMDHRSRSSPLPGQDIRNQPFMDQFKLLMDLDNGDDILADWDPQPMDVDRWELVLSPEEYLNQFKDLLADMQLISRAPLRRVTQPITGDQPSTGTSCWPRQHINYGSSCVTRSPSFKSSTGIRLLSPGDSTSKPAWGTSTCRQPCSSTASWLPDVTPSGSRHTARRCQ
ncbi:hypothetical protein EHS25_004893 [Saitozyma podzolica]|uniref:Uncharacterized protein n=1 Tax=Saitozyma podzolica TaxID=1890683 RepID=A0A427Y341_9TREE|nr:hypothetical protein EHS25_004893 [Saitozyma podzolica]